MKSPPQISLERKAWARGKLLVAWLKVAKAAENPELTLKQLTAPETDLRNAIAIATEWGIDPHQVLKEEGELAK